MGQFAKGKRPMLKTVEEAVDYLESLGLSVYGPNVDLSDGEVQPGCRDYSASQILQLRTLTERGELYAEEDES